MPRPWSEEADDVPGFRVGDNETPGFRVQENPMAPFGEGPASPASGNENAYPAFPDGGLGGDGVGFEQDGIGSPWGERMPDGSLGNEPTLPWAAKHRPFLFRALRDARAGSRSVAPVAAIRRR